MVYRKTWFDYLLLTVYTGICVMFLAYTGNRIYVTYVGAPLAKLGMFLPFPLLLCLYPGIWLSSLAIRRKYSFSAHALAMTEAFVVSVSFVFGTLIRMKEALVYDTGLDRQAGFGAGSYYDMAVVKAGEVSGPLAHGMSDLYVRCLRAVFSFLGNSVSAAMLFQAVLQVAAMLFAYLAVKKAAGRFAACTVLLLLAFSDAFIGRVGVVNPECLFLALFLAGLYLALCFVRGCLRGDSVFGRLPGAVFTGVFLGVLCYLELYCVILLLFFAGLMTGKSENSSERKYKAGRLLLALGGCVAGFVGAVAIDCLFSGLSFARGMLGWADVYRNPDIFNQDKWVWDRVIGIGTNPLFFAALFLVAAFVVFSFLRGGKEQVFSLWFLPVILVTPAFLIDFSVVGSGSITLFFWYTMAALGLQSVVLDGQAELMREKIEQINADFVPIPAAATDAVVSEPKPRFLENPLPLPKKHVKKEMDYDYPVAPDKMHFDLEPAEGDDYAL